MKKRTKNTRAGMPAYVCIEETFAGLKPAIYHFDYCLKVGDRAFIARSTPFHKLLVVPASWCFVTKAEAQRYVTNRGQLRWCVEERAGERDGHRTPELHVYQAKIRDVRENFYGDGSRSRRMVLRLDEGAEPAYVWDLRTFETKREAEAYARGELRKRIRSLEGEIRGLTKSLTLSRLMLRKLETS